MTTSTLRVAGLVAVGAGAGGSLVFLLHAGRSPALVLVLIMSAWVLSPFAALAVAGAISTRWSAPTRSALSWVMLALPLGSLVVYGVDFLHPPAVQRAFVFVVVPPVSWLLIAVAITSAARLSSKRATSSTTRTPRTS